MGWQWGTVNPPYLGVDRVQVWMTPYVCPTRPLYVVIPDMPLSGQFGAPPSSLAEKPLQGPSFQKLASPGIPGRDETGNGFWVTRGNGVLNGSG